MAIATASLDFDKYGRTPRVSPVTPELAALQACQFFNGTTPSALQSLAAAASLRSVARGTIVAAEGTVPAHALLVTRGRIRCVRRAANGREIALEVFRAGDLIVEGILAPQAPLANDWEALESATVLAIPREALVAYLRSAPDVILALAARLLSRLDRSKELAVGLALSDVEGRVVTALIRLGRQDGTESPEGLLIRQRPTQQEIANQIGACRETVSRTVSDLVRRGLLTTRGRSLLLSPRLFTNVA